MARVKKPQPALEALFFATPEQKVLRLLLSEPTTAFIPRVISSKLKGVRGLGGAEGLTGILSHLEQLDLVDFVDNRRAVRLRDEGMSVRQLKTLAAMCDLENLRASLLPISSRGILFGSRANGRARSDSDYDLFVVSEAPDEARKIAARHPMARQIELVVWTLEQYEKIGRDDPALERKLSGGIVLWGADW
ncbi:MAG: nucleotidyltransferase domain-containing protein [Oligoflexia bacterium]|nr:nucleotidyltransferase domain-containing protein [Oligoflexia bacterium]